MFDEKFGPWNTNSYKLLSEDIVPALKTIIPTAL